MHKFHLTLVVCLALGVCGMAVVQLHAVAERAADADKDHARREIEQTIRKFSACLSKRDADGLRSVLDARLMVVGPGREYAETGILDTSKVAQMLPPKGNDDWDRVTVPIVKVDISTTHPSVASASYILSFPLDDKRVAEMENWLTSTELDEARKKGLAARIDARAINDSMIAMLARQKSGEWKIVCMSFPK